MTTPLEDAEEINPKHLRDVLESLAQAGRRRFASDEEIEAALRRFEQFGPRS
jgi:hypothetical protein